jgi:hypothetical protein
MFRVMIIGIAGCLVVAGFAAAGGGITERVVAEFADIAEYDSVLCVTAQRMLLNADGESSSDAFSIRLERAPGGAFRNEQMDIDVQTRTINVAMTTVTVTEDGEEFATHVACKMVSRARVNNVLELNLSGDPRSCRDVNEHTYRLALATLSAEDRRGFSTKGTPLRFVDDYAASAGGEWLPSVVNDFIKPLDDGSAYIEVQAPSVQVPWDPAGRDWYKGTHHCKLITLTAMRRWITGGAQTGATELFPRHKAPCIEPSPMESKFGSCVFFFGPADSMFCQDFNGRGWTAESARAECGIRHATEAGWLAADKRYEGEGGIYDSSSCDGRGLDAGFSGTCVFHCNAPDESLWHVLGAGVSPKGMERACDLFIPAAQ